MNCQFCHIGSFAPLRSNTGEMTCADLGFGSNQYLPYLCHLTTHHLLIPIPIPIPTILLSSYHPPPLNMCRIPMILALSCFLPEFNAQANKCNQRKYQFSFPNNLMKHMTSRHSQSSGELNQLKATPSETLIRTSGKSRHGSTSRCTQPILPCGQISILNYIFH